MPTNSFCEWADTKLRKTPTWFALDDARPLFAFAGIWTRGAAHAGRSRTRSKANTGYGFLICPANGVVGLIHPKAMPVLQTTAEEYDVWLRAP